MLRIDICWPHVAIAPPFARHDVRRSPQFAFGRLLVSGSVRSCCGREADVSSARERCSTVLMLCWSPCLMKVHPRGVTRHTVVTRVFTLHEVRRMPFFCCLGETSRKDLERGKAITTYQNPSVGGRRTPCTLLRGRLTSDEFYQESSVSRIINTEAGHELSSLP